MSFLELLRFLYTFIQDTCIFYKINPRLRYVVPTLNIILVMPQIMNAGDNIMLETRVILILVLPRQFLDSTLHVYLEAFEILVDRKLALLQFDAT